MSRGTAVGTVGLGLSGRLGLAATRVPHIDRHGLLWLEFGRLSVDEGTLRFVAAKSDVLDAGDYDLPRFFAHLKT